MINGREYKFEEGKLTVEKGTFKLVAEGEFVRMFQTGKHGEVQILGVDRNGFSNVMGLFSTFLAAIDEINNPKEPSGKMYTGKGVDEAVAKEVAVDAMKTIEANKSEENK